MDPHCSLGQKTSLTNARRGVDHAQLVNRERAYDSRVELLGCDDVQYLDER